MEPMGIRYQGELAGQVGGGVARAVWHSQGACRGMAGTQPPFPHLPAPASLAVRKTEEGSVGTKERDPYP